MASDDKQSNQLNLTVVALVAVVAIVGLVALVLNAATLGKMATGNKMVQAQPPAVASEQQNLGGQAIAQPADAARCTRLVTGYGYTETCCVFADGSQKCTRS